MKVRETIKQDVVDQLAWDSRVNAADITVKVKGGAVTLAGTVPSYLDRYNAEEVARGVIGVTHVINNIDVNLETIPSDEDVKTAINNLWVLNSDVDATQITVSVKNGFVTLEGSVESYWSKLLAESEARSVKGVVDITNKLAVVPTDDIADEILADRVINRIEQNSIAPLDDIDIKVEDSQVVISGEVPSYSDWLNVYNAASNTLGVSDVRDQTSIVYA